MIVFFSRRVKHLIRRRSQRPSALPGPAASSRNLLLILLWTAASAAIFFAGFFLQAYHAFTREQPVAKVIISPLPENQKSVIHLELYGSQSTPDIRRFEIDGDQWILEGDILKWENWINFLGLHTRYRLTRIRGRYLRTSDETTKPESVYSLVDIEDHPLWGYLYRHGPSLPFVSAVYGNAVFQNSGDNNIYLVYVTTSGFLTRQIEN